MEIKYLTILKDNPSEYSDGRLGNRPLSYHPINNTNPDSTGIISAIEQLEITYNGGNTFPLLLRELLFIGGRTNWALGGRFPDEHENVVFILQERGIIISRPIFVIEEWESGFHFIYLDETAEDPKIYFSDFEVDVNSSLYVSEHKKSLSELINHRAACSLKDRDEGYQ